MGAAIAPNSTRQGDTLISSTGCTCFLIDGWVEGQYVTGVVAIEKGAFWSPAIMVANLKLMKTSRLLHVGLYVNSFLSPTWQINKRKRIYSSYLSFNFFLYLLPSLLFFSIDNDEIILELETKIIEFIAQNKGPLRRKSFLLDKEVRPVCETIFPADR